MPDMQKIALLFSGWDETLIWSCLQGVMGFAIADDDENPTAAAIITADFCFFAGIPNAALITRAPASIYTPQNAEWGSLIESVLGEKVEKRLRYAIKKDPSAFNTQKLAAFAAYPDKAYTFRFFDEEICTQALAEDWSRDFCSNFEDCSDFLRRGLGIAALYEGRLVAGASSYIVYNGGIEIEIDTKPEFRRKGLATACGSALILECLRRGLYPSWDAYDLRSVSLAEKLGYRLSHPYTVYMKK